MRFTKLLLTNSAVGSRVSHKTCAGEAVYLVSAATTVSTRFRQTFVDVCNTLRTTRERDMRTALQTRP